jgi:hypothetical protein
MTETSAEIIILVICALGAGILMFAGGVVQKLMNEMDPPEFKKFANALGRAAMSNPFAVTIATLPLFGIIFYFIVYGFNHWWFTAGLIIWFIGSAITKIINMPVLEWVGDPRNIDPEELGIQRRKLQLGNTLRAWITLASIILMACRFGAREVGIVVVFSVIITPPLLWLARKYIPARSD